MLKYFQTTVFFVLLSCKEKMYVTKNESHRNISEMVLVLSLDSITQDQVTLKNAIQNVRDSAINISLNAYSFLIEYFDSSSEFISDNTIYPDFTMTNQELLNSTKLVTIQPKGTFSYNVIIKREKIGKNIQSKRIRCIYRSFLRIPNEKK